MDWFEKFAKVVAGLDPIIEGIATLVFPETPIVAKAVKYGIGLVSDAQQAYGDGSGTIKKDFVMKGANDFMSGLLDVSTGGQKDTLEKFAPFMSTIVEGVVAGTKLVGVKYDDENAAISAGTPQGA